MTPDTLDAASELTQQYQQRTVLSAETSYLMLAGKRIRDARCAWHAFRLSSYGISRGVGNGYLVAI